MSKFAIEIKWAVAFTVVSLLWMFFEKAMGWHGEHIEQHALYTNFFAIPAIIIYVLAIRDKRENFFGGTMTWKQGFLSGSIVSIIVAALSPLEQYVVHTFITPEYLENMVAFSVEKETMKIEAAKEYFSLSSYMISSIFFALSAGIVTSAIVAWFLKRNAETTPQS
jgi:hypothetical protein